MRNIACTRPLIEESESRDELAFIKPRLKKCVLDRLGLVLFILIRYVLISVSVPIIMAPAHMFYRYLSLVTMVVSNVGFFSHSFTARICERYIRVYPVFKGTIALSPAIWAVGTHGLTDFLATQFFVSHIIMGVRYVLTAPASVISRSVADYQAQDVEHCPSQHLGWPDHFIGVFHCCGGWFSLPLISRSSFDL
jgi:Ni,Fe-hydrogenase I cytochrome b subunit